MPFPQKTVKRETAILISLVAFLLGILVGISYMVFRAVYVSEDTPKRLVSSMTQDLSIHSGSSRGPLETVRTFKSRAESDPKDVETWIQLGNEYFDSGQIPEAIDAYERALAFGPRDADVLTDLGIMYRRGGQPQRAVELFMEAQREDPHHMQSLYNLGVVLLHDLNDIPGAAQAWEAYIRLHPEGPHADRIRALLLRLMEEGLIPEPVS
jgi:cytochrome c-type biogenesis protein CcmH/NrfG